MITLTKEWLLKTIAELEEERDATPGAVNEDAAMALAAMKLALASLEAEAGVYQTHVIDDGCGEFSERMNFSLPVGTKLYTAPPAPETADREMLKRLAVILSGSDAPGEIRSLTVTAQSFVERCKALAKERDACHAVMLKSEVNGTPSLMAMMRALDAFYADDDVPERAMLTAFKILLADVNSQVAPQQEAK